MFLWEQQDGQSEQAADELTEAADQLAAAQVASSNEGFEALASPSSCARALEMYRSALCIAVAQWYTVKGRERRVLTVGLHRSCPYETLPSDIFGCSEHLPRRLAA